MKSACPHYHDGVCRRPGPCVYLQDEDRCVFHSDLYPPRNDRLDRLVESFFVACLIIAMLALAGLMVLRSGGTGGVL